MIDKKNLSSEDKEAWERFTKDPPDIYDKDLNNKKKGSRKHRFKFDLHGFTLEDANKKIQEIILSGVGKKYDPDTQYLGEGDAARHIALGWAAKNLTTLKKPMQEFIEFREAATTEDGSMDLHNNDLGQKMQAKTKQEAEQGIFKLIESNKAKFIPISEINRRDEEALENHRLQRELKGYEDG